MFLSPNFIENPNENNSLVWTNNQVIEIEF